MTTSDQINELAAALANAQGEMEGALKTASNPFFKSKYPDLASVRAACVPFLSKCGLAVLQSPTADGAKVSVETILMHLSGQWIKDTLTVIAKDETPQSVGSAITYVRRYALMSFAGVAPEDDDAETAQGRGNGRSSTPAQIPTPSAPKGYLDWLDDLRAVASEGTARLQTAWKDARPECRQHLTQTTPEKWEALKAIATKAGSAQRAS